MQGCRQKIFQGEGGATEKRPKISKNTEKWHYLPVPGPTEKKTEK